MIVYVPQDIHDRLNQRLKDMPEKIPDVLRKTINDTAKEARKSILSEAQKKYMVKAQGFNRAVKIENATIKYLQATVMTEGKPIPLYAFKIRKNRGPAAAKAQVLSAGSLKELTLRGGEDNGKDLKAFVQRMKNGHYGIFQRLNSGGKVKQQEFFNNRHGSGKKAVRKNAIKQLYSLSEPQMVESKRVYPLVQSTIETGLRINLEKHIASVMEGL